MHSSWKPRRRSALLDTVRNSVTDPFIARRRGRRSHGERRLADAAARGAAAPAATVARRAEAAHGSPEALLARSRHAARVRRLSAESVDQLEVTRRSRSASAARAWLAGPHRRSSRSAAQHYPRTPRATRRRAARALGRRPEPGAVVRRRSSRWSAAAARRRGGRETAEQFARYLERARPHDHERARDRHRRREPSRRAPAARRHRSPCSAAASTSIFPRAHAQLARRHRGSAGCSSRSIAPGVEPQKHHFPQRNRIIAGLSLGTLVVEATRRSGSLITAKHAMDYGREVFAIPGSIHNPLARGCHRSDPPAARSSSRKPRTFFVELAPQLKIDVASLPPPAPRATPNRDPLIRGSRRIRSYWK